MIKIISQKLFILFILPILGITIFFATTACYISELTSPSPAPTNALQTSTTKPATPAITKSNVITVTPTSLWSGLLLDMPVSFSTPLPPETWTLIDGTYAKIDPSDPQWWACRRCADYRPAGGIWKLQFTKGVMRIFYNVTGWRSISSYTISGDRLYLFNDPHCPGEVGEYTWRLEDQWGLDERLLVLDVISDSCSINLRGENLSDMPWDSCQSPNPMTGASDHWHKSPGCEIALTPPAPPEKTSLNVSVIVHPGDVRQFATEPDVYVDANKDEKIPPEGFQLVYSDDSISYGLNRVLWGDGSYVEVSTELPFNVVGVQIFGDHTIGWARVLFDGEEIWRGDTAAIWAYQGRNGGYIEVSGFEAGPHTLRVESMGFDYKPVTVPFFGFSYEGGVEAGK
jgi:hypothetical protein